MTLWVGLVGRERSAGWATMVGTRELEKVYREGWVIIRSGRY